MGFGDSIITTSVVKKAKAKFPDRSVCVGDGNTVHWCEVFDGNPHISRDITPDCVWVRHYPGNRPYIRQILPGRYLYDERFHVEPGEIYLTPEDLAFKDRDFVYIEPNVKGELGPNKDWGFDNWQKVVNALPGIRFIQGSGRRLAHVEQRSTASFRHACGLLSHAGAFVGGDGGLHHAAAALGKPAVVVWTGFSPSSVLGYDTHINLQAKTKICGRFAKCSHCEDAARAITVERVVESILRLVG